jgi:Tol biopolymer transport system component
MHLKSGDYLLIGPEKFKDLRTSRGPENELWFLSAKPGAKPVKLNQKMSEGAAVSKTSMKIAFSETRTQFPDMPMDSRLTIVEVDLSGGTPRLINRKVAYESKDRTCRLEAQDFYDNDRKMTFTCYEPEGMASVISMDLATGKLDNESKKPGTYNEVEGIFPDGKHTCVEADRQVDTLGGKRGFREIDIWKLRLGSDGKDFVRLTHFNDYEGWKASNPVISTDGKWMAFQIAKAADEAGVGYGIALMNLLR